MGFPENEGQQLHRLPPAKYRFQPLPGFLQKQLCRLLQTICLQDPKETSSVEDYTIKKVYDNYGRPSFKQVSVKADEEAPGSKQVSIKADEEEPGSKQVKVEADEEAKEYVECDFGKRLYQNKDEFLKSLSVLDEEEKDYILGLPWPLTKVWHVKNEKFARIITKLSGEKRNGK